jgi:addiction module HigA family antidote
MSDRRGQRPVHPGRVLELEFLEPLGMSAYALARAISVDPPRIYKIVAGERGISGDTALRLARYWGNSAQFWMNLQSRYELELARYEHEEEIERDVRPLSSV